MRLIWNPQNAGLEKRYGENIFVGQGYFKGSMTFWNGYKTVFILVRKITDHSVILILTLVAERTYVQF